MTDMTDIDVSKTESNEFSRTQLLLGDSAMQILRNSHVAVFGVGGVGGYVVEALARSGIGKIDIIDNDTVNITNINRQIIATHSTIGKFKVDVMKERILDINPNAVVNVHRIFYLPETSDQFDFSKYDYIVDAVDTVTAKMQIITQAKKVNTKVISSMGTGNKINPTLFEITDISKTSVCPLARVIRSECKKRGISGVKVLYSREKPIKINMNEENTVGKKVDVGSVSFVPSVAGLIITSEVIKDLVGRQ